MSMCFVRSSVSPSKRVRAPFISPRFSVHCFPPSSFTGRTYLHPCILRQRFQGSSFIKIHALRSTHSRNDQMETQRKTKNQGKTKQEFGKCLHCRSVSVSLSLSVGVGWGGTAGLIPKGGGPLFSLFFPHSCSLKPPLLYKSLGAYSFSPFSLSFSRLYYSC